MERSAECPHAFSCPGGQTWLKQGLWHVGTSILLTLFLGVLSVGVVGGGYCKIREFSAEQQPKPMWAHCWADTAESRKQRALTSKFHTPSNLCLGREASAGNPPYVFLHYKELQRMSSFLFKHPCIAVKQHWLGDEKRHQEHKRTPANGDRRAVTLLN